jgi:hypothetical protein
MCTKREDGKSSHCEGHGVSLVGSKPQPGFYLGAAKRQERDRGGRRWTDDSRRDSEDSYQHDSRQQHPVCIPPRAVMPGSRHFHRLAKPVGGPKPPYPLASLLDRHIGHVTEREATVGRHGSNRLVVVDCAELGTEHRLEHEEKDRQGDTRG